MVAIAMVGRAHFPSLKFLYSSSDTTPTLEERLDHHTLHYMHHPIYFYHQDPWKYAFLRDVGATKDFKPCAKTWQRTQVHKLI